MHAAGLIHRTTYKEQSKAEQRIARLPLSPDFDSKKKKDPAVISSNFGFRIFLKFLERLSVCIALHCIA